MVSSLVHGSALAVALHMAAGGGGPPPENALQPELQVHEEETPWIEPDPPPFLTDPEPAVVEEAVQPEEPEMEPVDDLPPLEDLPEITALVSVRTDHPIQLRPRKTPPPAPSTALRTGPQAPALLVAAPPPPPPAPRAAKPGCAPRFRQGECEPPEYPREARRRGLEGRVSLRILVAEDGNVAQVEVAESSGEESLDNAAVDAARQWKFTPATRDGRAVAEWIRVPVRFSLRG